MKKIESVFIEMGEGVKDAGHIKLWFKKNTKRFLVLHNPQTFLQKPSYLEVYLNGKIVNKKYFFFYKGKNKMLKYFFYYIYFYSIILTKIEPNTLIIVLHPFYLIFNGLISKIRKITYIIWIWDYFPSISLVSALYNFLVKHYISKLKYVFYLSSHLKKIYKDNKNSDHLVIPLGVKIQKKITFNHDKIVLGYIGLVSKNKGLDYILPLLKKDKNIYLEIIGIEDNSIYLSKKVNQFNLNKQVRFFGYVENNSLRHIVTRWTAALALYHNDDIDTARFTDLGKIKLYLEYNLPIIITNINSISIQLKKYGAGVIVNPKLTKEIQEAVYNIKKNFYKYSEGTVQLAKEFNYLKLYYPFKKINSRLIK